jgi:2-polyprenyl-3-methyl-5-hydroxy-6-metoxy-1,4-benzoquinol methylase
MPNNRDRSWLPYMARTKNYNNWIFNQYKKFLGNTIMDVGCGHGTFVDFIKERKKILLTEVSPEAVARLRRKYKKNKNISILKLDLSKDGSASKMKKRKADTIVCLNVLEHVREDSALIKNARKVIRPKGKLVLYVPAKKFLFGTLDINLGHFRRYEKRGLETMLAKNGFKVIMSKYVNLIGVLSWFLYSRILKRKKVKAERILFYDRWFVPFLSIAEKIIPIPIGQSLLIIAEAK